MKLTSFTDYSLRLMIYLAVDSDRRATVSEVATAFCVSEHHLTKVVHFLGQQGWLTTIRGKGGGVELAMASEHIVIGKVVRATERGDMPAECFGKMTDTCPISGVCRLRGVLHEAVEAFYAVLDQYTLADLVRNRKVLAGILHIAPLAMR